MQHGSTVTFAYKQAEIVQKFISGLHFDGPGVSLSDFVIKDMFVSHNPIVVKGLHVPTGTNGFGDYVITLSHDCTFGIEFENVKDGFSFVYLADVDYSPAVRQGLPELNGRLASRTSFSLDPEYLYVPCERMDLLEFNQEWNKYRSCNVVVTDLEGELVSEPRTLS